ncbi:recombinase family protein [Synechococcus elongatus]|uniref:recombinase family protein n=1 Tax=Synechococcus elongatus TaxID=32046 RepID=UPI0030CB9BCD
MAQYVTYLRLSRGSKNGRNYGLEAQRRDLDIFLAQFCPDESGCEEIASFTEIQSGADDDRPQLAKAIAHCQKTGATLLVSKLDRLSRRVSFIAQMLETKDLNFKVASMPNADKFQLHIYAALAEQEREFIGARTKAGLARAKATGKALGGIRSGQEKAREATHDKAVKFAESLRAIITPMVREGQSLRAIATSLESAGIKTSTGRSNWSAVAVKRIINHLETIEKLDNIDLSS